jgi:type IV secretion system protein VirB9
MQQSSHSVARSGWAGLAVVLACGPTHAQEQVAGASAGNDPRLQEVWYDPQAVVTVPVRRGVVTHIVLDGGEAITDVGTGLGADCSKPEASWCIAAQPGGHHLFVKPKSSAQAANNLAVVTDKRIHAFRFVVLPPGDARSPVYRLIVKVQPTRRLAARAIEPAAPTVLSPLPPEPIPPLPGEVVSERLGAAPELINSDYSVAEGDNSQDIAPTLIFDDGRFTYLRFPNNREVPAVFHVLGDGSETLVNTRMEGDLLVVDRVSRRLMLRAGSAVVGVWNEAFDIDGLPPAGSTTVAGVRRALKVAGGSGSVAPMPGGRR